jgi:hypothetical protein
MISKTATGPDQYHPLVHLNDTKLSILGKFNDSTAANLLVSGNMTLLGPNGHITASGNISASGTGSFGYIEASGLVNHTNDDNTGLEFSSDTVIIQGNGVHAALFSSTANILNVPTTINDDLTITGSINISGSIVGNIDVTHITASGNISASGNMFANNITLKGNIIGDDSTVISNIAHIEADEYLADSDGATGMRLSTDLIKFSDNGENEKIFFNPAAGHITASGNISASGTLLINKGVFGTDDSEQPRVVINPTGHITASGNISSSGFMSASAFVGDGSGLTGVVAAVPSGTISSSLQVFSSITASGNISASGNIYSTNVESTDTITAVSGAFSYITASIIDVDANTIRLGGSPFSKTDVDNLKDGKMPEQTAREGFTNRLQPEAIFGKHDGDYIKFTVGHRIGTFISGTLFHDMNLTGSNNYFAVGKDSNTQLRLTGQITASSHISASGTLQGASLKVDDGTQFFGIKRLITSDGKYEFRDGSVHVSSGHITASGNISASGTSLITAQDLTLDRQLTVPTITNVNTTHITASGNISASGKLTAASLNTGQGDYELYNMNQNVTTTSDVTFNNVTASLNLKVNGDTLLGNHESDTHTFNGHITASGNISSSGTITADTLTPNNIVFTPSATSIKIEAPDETAGSVNGAGLTIEAGDAFGSNFNGGDVTIQAGKGSGAGDGGNIVINAGGGLPSGSISLNAPSIIASDLPTSQPTTTGSLWLSGSNAEGSSKYLMVFTG